MDNAQTPHSDKKPFFSVVIATYNRSAFLGIAVGSVLRQSFGDYELIVVDDGSHDDTASRLARIDDGRLRYIYQQNRGPAAARNRGVAEARGSWICFLDSDDRYHQDKLLRTRSAIGDHPAYDIFHTNEVWYRNGSLLQQGKVHKKPHGNVFDQALTMCCISISTVAVRASVFEDVGPFDETMPACEDYDFWLKVTSRYPVFLIAEYLTIKEGGHADQQSKKYPGAMDSFRLYALQKIIVSGTLTDAQSQMAWREFEAKCDVYLGGARKRNRSDEVRHWEEVRAELARRLQVRA